MPEQQTKPKKLSMVQQSIIDARNAPVLTPAMQAALDALVSAPMTGGEVNDLTQHKIRLAGIDAPERHQAWGGKSKLNMSRLSFNQTAVADCSKVDRWGRQICKVTVNAVDIGLEQISDGMAWWYKKYAKEQAPEDRSVYENAELMAQLRRLGLWGDTNPMPPWDFKRENQVGRLVG